MKKWICVCLVALLGVVALTACKTPMDVTLSEVSVKKGPTKSSYFVGENLDLTGARLLIKYTDGTEKEMEMIGTMISPVDMDTAGNKTVTVTYTEGLITKTTTFPIEVKAKTVVEEHVSAALTDWYEREGQKELDTSVTFDNKKVPYGAWQKVTFTLYQNDTSIGKATSSGDRLKALLQQNETHWVNKDTSLTLSCAFQTRLIAGETDYWSYSMFASTEDSELQPNKLIVEIETVDSIYKATFTKTVE